MAGRHVLASPPSSRIACPSLIGQIQTQAMSHAKFVFLIALVIFFVVLFVVAYVWMRRPDFGQKGGDSMPTVSGDAVGCQRGRANPGPMPRPFPWTPKSDVR